MLKLSIIIPVYNQELYLPMAVKSALLQQISGFEVIVVNDGSTDRSGLIAEEFADKYPNVKVIGLANQGASAARNAGIRAAEGEFLLFLDGDDYLIANCLNDALLYCCRDCDVVMFSSYKSNRKRSRYCVDMLWQDGEMCGGRMFPVSGHFGSLLYKKSLLKEHRIFFDEGVRIGEDQVFKVKALYAAKKIMSYARPLYVYNAASGSVMQPPDREFERVTAWRKAYEWFAVHAAEEHRQECLSYVQKKLNSRMLLYAKSFVQSGHNREELIAELERAGCYDLLMGLGKDEVMKYQQQELICFQEELDEFVNRSRREGVKVSLGRRVLKIPFVRSLRDKKRYPLEIG